MFMSQVYFFFIIVGTCVVACAHGKHSVLKVSSANLPGPNKSSYSDGTCHGPNTVPALDINYLVYVSQQTESRVL